MAIPSTNILYSYLNTYAEEFASIAKSKGFDDDRTFGDDIALIHSEASEALEEYRVTKDIQTLIYSNIGNNKPIGVPSELADIIIRVLEMCGRRKIDIATAVEAKVAYNRTREFRHGNKAL